MNKFFTVCFAHDKLSCWNLFQHDNKGIYYKNKKDLGVIIQFDNKEYPEKEIEFLWERFIFILAEAQNIDFDPKITRNLIKTMVSEAFKDTKETRTPSNTDEQRNFNQFFKICIFTKNIKERTLWEVIEVIEETMF